MPHRHKATTSTIDRCFSGCVAGYRCEPMAHGWATYTERCSCGAQREVNYNQEFIERSPWMVEDEED